MGLEPEIVQILICNAIYEFGPHSFVGIRQAAIYAMMYWGTARFEEVKELELRQICKKGASLEIKILKGKCNKTKKLQRCVIHPNYLVFQGKMCPVALIDSYLTLRNKLGHNWDNDYIFPQVGAKFERIVPTHEIVIQIPTVAITYNNYIKRLKKHLECKTLKEMGVYQEDSTHSFRQEGLSVLADGDMHPAFIQKSA